MATTTLRLTSRGAITGHTVGVVRLHRSTGTNGHASGVFHVYCGTDVDTRFQTARFTVGGVPVPHRRFRVQRGVSADFLLRLDVPALGETVSVVVDYIASGRTTESTDAAVLLWGLDGWRRANGSGLLLAREGGEVSVLRENGKTRIWYTYRATGDAQVPFGISYRETTDPDLLTGWSDPGVCIPAPCMHARVTRGPDGRYHMLGTVNPPGAVVNYYTSDTGDPGTWTLDTAAVIDYGMQNGAGNHYPHWLPETNEWLVMSEGHLITRANWCMFLYRGPTLRELTPYAGNPIRGLDGIMRGGGRLFRSGEKWCYIGYGATDGGNHGVGLPTELMYSESLAPEGPWTTLCSALRLQEYHGSINAFQDIVFPDQWSTNRVVSAASQLADPGWYEEDGVVHLFYEDVLNQAQPWTISLLEWDAPMARIIDSTITHARMDDVEAEGWAPTDVTTNSIPVGAHFRKMTRNTYLGNPVTFEIKGPFETSRPMVLDRDEVVVHLAARNQTASSSFTACRVDTAAGAPLAAIILDSDGHLKAYDGSGTRELGAYVAGTYYAIRLVLWATGYDVVIDGVIVASGLPYQSAWARPGRLAIGLSAATYAYVGELFVTAASAAEPTWDGAPPPEPPPTPGVLYYLSGGAWHEVTPTRLVNGEWLPAPWTPGA